jgi:hypothetical protein
MANVLNIKTGQSLSRSLIRVIVVQRLDTTHRYLMVLAMATSDWRGRDFTSPLPIWDEESPFSKVILQRTQVRIVNKYGKTIVDIPAVNDDPHLKEVIAAFAGVPAFGRAKRYQYVASLEAVARLYDSLGGDRASWLRYLRQTFTIFAYRNANIFLLFLKLINGSDAPPSDVLSRLAAVLAEWADLPGTERPSPWHPTGVPEIGGTTPLGEWIKSHHGYRKIADGRHDRIAWIGSIENELSEHGYFLTPPELRAWLKARFGDFWDACPHPRQAFDSLTMPWPKQYKIFLLMPHF